MQPYFLPFIGYFQLIDAVDTFVLYDDAQFTKKGFMTTNRLGLADGDQPFSLNVRDKKKIDRIDNKTIATEEFLKSWRRQKAKLARLPFFDEAIFDRLILPQTDNLFDYLSEQIQIVCDMLDIKTHIARSSALANTGHLVGQEKIVALCKAANDFNYLNSSGGKALYSKAGLAASGIELKWLHYQPTVGELTAPYSIIQSLAEMPIDSIKKLAKHHVIE